MLDADPSASTTARTLSGEVVAVRAKTIVVRVTRRRMHAKYGKSFLAHKKYHAHDEEGKAKIGDVVTIVECRPLSALKRWKLLTITSSTSL